MKEIYKRSKQLIVTFLCALLVISQISIAAPVSSQAKETDGNEKQAAEFKAAAEGDTYLAFSSDVHNNSADAAANRMDTWLNNVQPKYNNNIKVMSFCGDLGHMNISGQSFWNAVQNVMDVVDENGLTGIYTTGNHEYMNGSYSSSLTYNSAKKLQISEVGEEGDNYVIYCLGSEGQSQSVTSTQMSKLSSFLDGANKDKPIIIITHFPLHYFNSRTTSNASDVIDLLNNATDAGKKIIFLWGHNHTMSDSNYDQVFAPGSTLEYSRGNSKKIKFHYAAGGCMSGSEYSSGSTYVKGKGLVLTIGSDDMLTMAYYDENGNNVTEGGTYSEDGSAVDPVDPVDPPTGDTVNIEPSTSKPEASIKIGVGDTLTINVTNGSSNSAYDFTATVANSSIAQIQGDATKNIAKGAQGQFTVKGLAEGTVDITIQNNSSYGSSYTRIGTIHLTVGEGGGTTPVDPPTGNTVSIEPSTDKPEASIKIGVGDTLTINVKNGSSNSAYDFTATLSKSGVAQIQGDATKNIAAGKEAAFTVKGLAEGTVDITIQNSNSYSSSYNRVGTIHLTVGEGGTTPVDPDPQTGDKVSITPSTENPEESIKINVGDTLSIDVKNGSTRSAYDFTATVGNSSIVQIQGDATMNIASEKSATFTVKGLAAGSTDVTIQNTNEYGSQYVRKGIVHVTVVETAPHTHTWNDGVVTTPATCTAKGVKTFTCTGCGETRTEDIDALGHNYETVADSAVAATCTAAGKEADKKCSRCNDVIEGAVIEALGHDYQEVEDSAVAATCTAAGKEADKKCSRCNDVIEGAVIDALGHDYQEVEDSAVAATCTKAGKEADKKCSRCNDVIEGAVIDALGHDFGEWKTIAEATETSAGMKARSCTRCDEIEYEEIPKKTTPSGDDTKKTDPTTPTNESKKSGDSKTPTADEIAKAPVDNSLPVINPEKIKTTGSVANKTMTIKLGTVNMDNCLVEYKEASASKWTSVWYGQGSQLVIKGMKKNGFYQYRFTVAKKINGQWKKSKPSNTCYRWIMNVKAKKPTAGKKRMTVKWKKVKKANGYEIQYATNKAFTKNLKKATVKGAKKTSKTIRGLKKGKTYYVRIRPYKTNGGKKYLGILTKAKKVKIK